MWGGRGRGRGEMWGGRGGEGEVGGDVGRER